MKCNINPCQHKVTVHQQNRLKMLQYIWYCTEYKT